MAKLSGKYSLEMIKKDMKKVINKYLQDHFPDLFNGEKETRGTYKTTFSRVFSSHGEEGYKRAYKLIKTIDDYTDSSLAEIVEIILNQSGDGTLHENLVTKLYQKALVQEKALEEEYSEQRSSLVETVDVHAQIAITDTMIREILLKNALKSPVEMVPMSHDNKGSG